MKRERNVRENTEAMASGLEPGLTLKCGLSAATERTP
jgi:hypothetical protein